MKEKILNFLKNIKLPLILIISSLVVLVVVMSTMSVLRPYDDVDVSHDDLMHDYVKTTVVEKRFEEGNGWLFFYNPPVYYIISIDNDQTTWVTTVDQATYDLTTIGTTLDVCRRHGKICGQ